MPEDLVSVCRYPVKSAGPQGLAACDRVAETAPYDRGLPMLGGIEVAFPVDAVPTVVASTFDVASDDHQELVARRARGPSIPWRRVAPRHVPLRPPCARPSPFGW